MYFGPPCYDYAFNCYFVHLAIPGHICVLIESKVCLFYLNAIAKDVIQICSNIHETGLILLR